MGIGSHVPAPPSDRSVTSVMRDDLAVRRVEIALGICIRGGVGFSVRSSTGAPLAAVVFHEHRPPTIECSVAAKSPLWARKGVLRDLLRYPFTSLGCKTLLTLIPSRNERSRRFNSGIGFELVGTITDGAEDDDLCLYQMTRERASRWLKA